MASQRRKLTKTLVDGLSAPEADTFYWDTEVPGFGLRVWPSGKKVYVFQYRTRHKQTRRPVIGQHGAITVQQARQIARDWAAEVHKGGDPSGSRKDARSATIRELADRYLMEHARPKKKPRSVRSDEALLNRHIIPAL